MRDAVKAQIRTYMVAQGVSEADAQITTDLAMHAADMAFDTLMRTTEAACPRHIFNVRTLALGLIRTMAETEDANMAEAARASGATIRDAELYLGPDAVQPHG